MKMQNTRLIAIVVGLAAIATLTANASAYYHPTIGRFVSRDPGAGRNANSPAQTAHFPPRDPSGSNQYADGMNLYEYVRSQPTSLVDPQGLAAWKHTNWWNDGWKQKYRNFVSQHAKDYVKRPEDCATLTVMLLVDFAAKNGLPVTLRGQGGCLWISKSCQFWKGKDDFYQRVTKGGKGQRGVHSYEVFNHNTGPDKKDEAILSGDVGTKLGHAFLVVNAMKPGVLSAGQQRNLPTTSPAPTSQPTTARRPTSQPTTATAGVITAKPWVQKWDEVYAYSHPEKHFFIYSPSSTKEVRIDYLNHSGVGKRTAVAEIKYNRLVSELKAAGFHFRFWHRIVFSNYKTWDGKTRLKEECEK